MKQCTKDVEIELADGTLIETKLIVTGIYDEEFTPDVDKKSEPGAWLVDSWSAECEEELDEDQQADFDEQIEEIVFSEKWDFENAPETDDEMDEETELH